MNENIVLGLLYARAFLNRYYKEYTLEDFQVLQEAAYFFKNHTKACFFMQLSLLDRKVKEDALHLVCNQLSLPITFKKLFSLLIDQKRVFLLPVIFTQLVEEYQKRAGYMPVTITSAQKLSPYQEQELIHFLVRKTHKTIIPTFAIDPNLIAGVRMCSGTYLFEQSVAGTLKKAFRSLQLS